MRIPRMALTLLALAGSTARADLIVDGGFEPPNPTTTPDQFQSGSVSEPLGASFGGPSNNACTVELLDRRSAGPRPCGAG